MSVLAESGHGSDFVYERDFPVVYIVYFVNDRLKGVFKLFFKRVIKRLRLRFGSFSCHNVDHGVEQVGAYGGIFHKLIKREAEIENDYKRIEIVIYARKILLDMLKRIIHNVKVLIFRCKLLIAHSGGRNILFGFKPFRDVRENKPVFLRRGRHAAPLERGKGFFYTVLAGAVEGRSERAGDYIEKSFPGHPHWQAFQKLSRIVSKL